MTSPDDSAPNPPAGGNLPLSAPYYGATFPIAFSRFWSKYATFSGSASRSEFWWMALVFLIVNLALQAIAVSFGSPVDPTADPAGLNPLVPQATVGSVIAIVLGTLWAIVALVPSLALIWRRLHDANLSGLFWLLVAIPVVGGVIVLVLLLLPPDPRGVRFDR